MFLFKSFYRIDKKILKTVMSEPKRARLTGIPNVSDRLIWVDCEMTGLDPQKDSLLEMACLVTEGNLDVVAQGPSLIIHQPDDVLDKMNDWCIEHHGKSGLTAAVRNSKITLGEAEKQFLSFVQEHTLQGKCPLAGNSVHADKKFLEKYMPAFTNHLHYRIVDVSTVKEICRRWYPKEFGNAPQKKLGHRALDDILESIKELQYYQKTIFKGKDVVNPESGEA